MKNTVQAITNRIIRRYAGAETNTPIVMLDNDQSPKYVGTPFHYVNKSGDLIRHPSAYMRAFGKPIYVASSVCVQVGKKFWLDIQDVVAAGLQYKLDLRSGSKLPRKYDKAVEACDWYEKH